jgi:hypothetical protein
MPKEYEVEQIKGKKYINDKKYYLLKWKDYDEKSNSWEPAKGLTNISNLIEQYDKDYGTDKEDDDKVLKKKRGRPKKVEKKSMKKDALSKSQDKSKDLKKLSVKKVSHDKKSKNDNESSTTPKSRSVSGSSSISKTEEWIWKKCLNSQNETSKEIKKPRTELAPSIKRPVLDDHSKNDDHKKEDSLNSEDKEKSDKMVECNFTDAICKKDIMEESSKIQEGTLLFDIPKRIIRIQKDGENQLQLLIEWSRRYDGKLPLPSFVYSDPFKEHYSKMLLEFYEDKLKKA